jgi:RNA polymerase sigma-70 factor, ECF subfamily
VKENFQSDIVLIEKIKGGDQYALNELVRKHQDRAYVYAFRLTRNAEEASDVVADSFVRINNSIRNFKGNSAFTTWLYRIVTNCYLDIKKKDKSRFQVSIDSGLQHEDEEITREFEDSGRKTDELVERNQRELFLQKALNQLPEFQKSMIVMFHAEQLSYEEISEALDLPLGTVKSRLNRARISLKEILMENEELFKV